MKNKTSQRKQERQQMVSQKRKLMKQKAKERETKAKLLRRREAARKKTKLERMAAEIEQASRPKMVPYRKDQDEEYKAKVSEANLEHNIQILQALEEQYLEEQKAKQELNKELEEQGYQSLEEKMNALHQQAIEAAEKAEGKKVEVAGGTLEDVKNFVKQNAETLKKRKNKRKITGSAKYRFVPNASDKEKE